MTARTNVGPRGDLAVAREAGVSVRELATRHQRDALSALWTTVTCPPRPKHVRAVASYNRWRDVYGAPVFGIDALRFGAAGELLVRPLGDDEWIDGGTFELNEGGT